MNPTLPRPPLARLPALRQLLLLATLPLSLPAQTPAAGRIEGRVSSVANGEYIHQAAVTLQGTNYKQTTASDGRFTFNNIPAGDYTLAVSYVDCETWERNVTIAAGAPVSLDIALEPAVLKLEAMTITSQREGDAVSIIRRRNADNLVNVISMDAYGTVADGNIGNFLINLPGLASTQPGGEVTGITVRGMAPELNAVTVDGVRAAAASAGSQAQGDRAVLIDQIPSEFIKEIEVTKALLPEQPADSLGGSINLVQKHPSDFKRRVVNYSAGLFHNTYRDNNQEFAPNFAATYIDKLGSARKLSYSISASYNVQGGVPHDRVQVKYDTPYYPLNYTPSGPDDPGRAGYPIDPGDISVTSIRMLSGEMTRVRAGSDAALVYEFDRTARVWLKGRYTYFSEDMNRTDYQFIGSTTTMLPEDQDPRDDAFSILPRATWRQGAMNTTRLSRQGVIMAGLEKEGDGSLFRLRASYNPSKYINRLRAATAHMNSGLADSDWPTIYIDTTDRFFPTFKRLSGLSNEYGETDFDKYSFEVRYGDEETREDMTNINMLHERRFFLFGIPAKFKTGVDYRRQHRTSSANDITWLYRPAVYKNVAQFMTGGPGYGLFNGRYDSYDVIDLDYSQRFFQKNPSDFTDYQGKAGAVLPPSVITEGVLGAFGQAHLTFGQLSVLGGVRYEWTNVNSRGSSYQLTGLSSGQRTSDINTTTHSSDYGKIFPSIHFRYEPLRRLVFRASVSSGMARPALNLITPTIIINNNVPDDGDGTERGMVTENNPNLKPQYAINYDLSAEYYIEPGGVFSVGAFQKDITDFLAPLRERIGAGPDNGFNGNYANYRYSTWFNMGRAKVRGIEIEYKQRFTFLPKPFNSLYIYGGYTHIRTEGTYNDNATDLVGFIPDVWSAGLSFTWRQMEFRAIHRYTGENLSNYSNIQQDILWRTYNATWDFNMQYSFRPWLAFYVDLVNATNSSPAYFSQTGRRIQWNECAGARLGFGIKGRF
ncbi:MAG: TonB-dependent receptor [Opitutaceae bacterium]|jgi:TonB-dependent receptor|nr:TonB-dependent receptor [Opitutaceae bacterium]